MKGKLWAIALSFLVIVILLFMGLYFRVEDKLFPQPKLRFTIRFADATGVHTESKVFLLGIPAGKVDSLDYNPDNRYPKLPVSVQVSITRDIKVPRSVHASLQPTLLGESSIELVCTASPFAFAAIRQRAKHSARSLLMLFELKIPLSHRNDRY
jgi:ABC-type transporter Mla subunit MlaD